MKGAAEPGAALVFVQIGSSRYAFSLKAVQEILPLLEPTPVPAWPPSALGVINLRGEHLPLVDIAPLLGLPPSPISPTQHIVVVSALGRRWGVLTDQVEEICAGPVRRQPLGGEEDSDSPAICEGVTAESSGSSVVVLSAAGLFRRLRSLDA